jgi:RNA polymerase sigma factor (sigma-70 family)
MTNTVSDIQNLEAHRSAITGHCYRMLGSFFDAEDATQEAMIRAWKGMDRFDGRASIKNWLYRIATNVCLDEIHNKGAAGASNGGRIGIPRHTFCRGLGAAPRERVD